MTDIGCWGRANYCVRYCLHYVIPLNPETQPMVDGRPVGGSDLDSRLVPFGHLSGCKGKNRTEFRKRSNVGDRPNIRGEKECGRGSRWSRWSSGSRREQREQKEGSRPSSSTCMHESGAEKVGTVLASPAYRRIQTRSPTCTRYRDRTYRSYIDISQWPRS